MDFKAVLFDLDGTLFNSVHDLAESVNKALEQENLPTHEIDAYNYFVGDGFKNLIKRALSKDLQNDEKLVERILENSRSEYITRMDRYSYPYPQIDTMLNELTARGFRLCVLSNKPDAQTKELVQKHFSQWTFEFVFGARPEKHEIKPNPSAAFEICELMHLQPQDYLYLGDTSTDMQTANAAGMWAVGVLWGFRPESELEEHGAKWLLENPMQLFDFLDGKK